MTIKLLKLIDPKSFKDRKALDMKPKNLSQNKKLFNPKNCKLHKASQKKNLKIPT
jgi:hypothetical protein